MVNDDFQSENSNYVPKKRCPTLVIIVFIILLAATAFLSYNFGKSETEKNSSLLQERFEIEISELIQKHQEELHEQYVRGLEAGHEEGLNAEQQEIYKKGEREGYAQGLLIGREEARTQNNQKLLRLEQDKAELEKLRKQKAMETTEYEARIKKMQTDLNELSRKLQNVQANRDTLMSKLRKAVDRIDQYELDTKRR